MTNVSGQAWTNLFFVADLGMPPALFGAAAPALAALYAVGDLVELVGPS